ncbi:MAG TPA: hypothetical protein VGK42_00940 [Candidatus Dormibacteraeota bacterium]
MFVAVGEIGPEAGLAARFCQWARRLGHEARLLIPALPDDARDVVAELGGDGVDVFVISGSARPHLIGARLLHLEARHLLDSSLAGIARGAFEEARRNGALISIDLGDFEWIGERGGSRTAYALAAIHPDILFADTLSAAQLGAPLEGIASVPVVKRPDGCSVFGRYVAAPAMAPAAPGAVEAAFCVAFLEGHAPVEAAGRAVLIR